MDIDLAEIEQSLVMVYQKNLIFLKNNFFDIFEAIEQFSNDLEIGKIKEKYSLELKDGYFDILNLKNNGFYYAKNTYQDAEDRAQFVDFSNQSSYDLLRKQGDSQYLAMPYGLEDILPIVEFINKTVDLNNLTFQKIMKFIYMGVGLGYHIQEIEKKIDSYTTLIIEPELEIFRLSLFTTDYSIFEKGNKKLFLSIGDDKNERNKVLGLFYNYHGYMNYNIKHYSLLQNLDYINKEIVEFLKNNYAGLFPYTLVIQNVKRTVSFMRDLDRFLVVRDIKKEDIFKNKKVLIVSAGPSLDGYIENIKKYQDKFVIVCVDVIVRKLEKHNILPDIIFSIDPSPLCADYLTTEDPSYLRNSAIVLLSQQHDKTMEILKERNLNYYFSQFALINKEIGYLGSVSNVGTFSFQTMIHLGAKELYLIGNDACFNQETGERYSSDSSFSLTEELSVKKVSDSVISNEDIMEVKGNLVDKVNTNRSLMEFKYSYDTSIAALSGYEYNAYNLSNGVFIEGLTPLTEEDFISFAEDIDEIDEDFKELFDSISQILDVACYKKDINILNNIIQRARKFTKIKSNTRDEFLANKLDMMIWILEKTKGLSISTHGNIFLHYTNLVDSYINFFMNLEQENLYTEENFDMLSNLWAKGVVALFKNLKNSVS